MILGIDLDETIVNTHEYAIKYLNNKYDYINESSYLNLQKEYSKEVKESVPEILKGVLLKDNVIYILNYFKALGWKIIIITYRGKKGEEDLVNITYDYLKKYNVPYDKIYFGVRNKGKVAKKEGVKYFIDDHEVNLDSIYSRGIRTLKMKSDTEKISKYKVFNNWIEIKDYILKDWGNENG